MPTQIRNLPCLSFGMIVGNNEDWLDSWEYLDPSSAPISLAGLTLNFMVRPAANSSSASVIASTAASVAGLPVNGTVVVGGAGNSVAALNIPRAFMLGRAAGAYVFELQAAGDGVTRTIATGPASVVEGIVR